MPSQSPNDPQPSSLPCPFRCDHNGRFSGHDDLDDESRRQQLVATVLKMANHPDAAKKKAAQARQFVEK
ncbi:hypothetical protein RMSM_01920 [Rhodopirellula maiorica SM1]|uniref:Uncharacterized protein n=1 Tax=Rhodopirellula maiorica SM1 TaxID=1265738 RepID=M5RP72_9BACT|nr:hypothetical protein [Rhodopirellula maiorica]EMI21133.1 hypothetical protein RMSM_01920 [Rhodopirellula maiorica SM1]